MRPAVATLADGITRRALPADTWGASAWLSVIESVPALERVHDIPVARANVSVSAAKDRATRDSRFVEPYRQRWYGNLAGVREAGALLQAGSPEGAERVASLVREIAPRLPAAPSVRRRPTWGEDGDLCVDRWLGGADAMFRTARRASVPSFLTVSLVASWGGNAALNAEQITWSGVAAAALADALERAGYSVNVAAVAHQSHRGTRGKGGAGVNVLHVKRAGEMLSPGHLAAALAHPASYRCHALRLDETLPHHIGTGYGAAHGASASAIAAATAAGVLEPTAFVVPLVTSREEAIREVSRIIDAMQAGPC